VPITGGNVSLYNETNGEAIYPTPTIGVVGLIEDASKVLGRTFRGSGDAIVLLGDNLGELGGSEYLKVVHGLVRGVPPALDLAREQALIALVTDAAARSLIRSAHDCADGGLAITLAECAFDTEGIGLSVDVPAAAGSDPAQPLGVAATLFGESASRIVVTVGEAERTAFLQLAAERGVPALVVGTTGGSRIAVAVAGTPALDVPLAEAESIWSGTLASYFTRHGDGRAA